jgi:hypothetical protein
MSITTYLSAPTRGKLDLDRMDPDTINSVRVIAVNHASDWSGEKPVSKCGHKRGWPDTDMTELLPECEDAGCTLGFSVTRFIGMIVSDRERNMHDDSDFFATWYDKDTDTLGEEMTGSTRGWSYFNGSSIDADDETMAAYRENRKRAEEAGRKWREEKEVEAEAQVPSLGKEVRVKSKRSKVPFGTQGRVFYFRESAYSRPDYYANPNAGFLSTKSEKVVDNLRDYRVGFETQEGTKFYCSATCVEIVVTEDSITGRKKSEKDPTNV